MEGPGFIIFVIVIAVLVVGLKTYFKASADFIDPKTMTHHQLVSSIAGQADWLEKMSRSPIDSQNNPSIIEIARKRRGYIARLCLEGFSKAPDDQLKYEGDAVGFDPFKEAREYAKELEANGMSRDNAAVRAVKEKLFKANGVNYPTKWEI